MFAFWYFHCHSDSAPGDLQTKTNTITHLFKTAKASFGRTVSTLKDRHNKVVVIEHSLASMVKANKFARDSMHYRKHKLTLQQLSMDSPTFEQLQKDFKDGNDGRPLTFVAKVCLPLTQTSQICTYFSWESYILYKISVHLNAGDPIKRT